ncbi:hypothetical protein B7Q40_003710 [Salmonella enterica subsp. enterica serovar Java]|nr:hypothetical protein [Salmonella enterica]EDC4058255.1 hypothetical protein [Salmonella enterica subsp. enterica serovar Java]HCM8928381.1 hypothetical protein [Salmonella enterica subsp. enterica serovar Paratyphi B]EDR2523274.1 hypothetical protein [Salmonella enterica subsp. enterica serovar Java]EDU0622326.1 hypothetical protein [Salmonella enterica subsp. enterica serovar Java]
MKPPEIPFMLVNLHHAISGHSRDHTLKITVISATTGYLSLSVSGFTGTPMNKPNLHIAPTERD